VVHDFFEHFNIPLVQLPPITGDNTRMTNFENGETVSPSQLYMGNITNALLGYAAQEAKYASMFEDWHLPYPIPEDLLLPFGDFLIKHKLEAFAYIAFLYDQGMANILKQPTLYVMKYQDQVQIRDLLMGTFVVNAMQNNQLLYDRAHEELAESVYLSSYPTKITRTWDGVKVEISTPDGTEYIKARKLLMTIPPKSSLPFLDLDHHEQSLFKRFNSSYYWNGVLKNTGLPIGTTFPNVNPNAAMNLPAMPGLYTFLAAPVPGLHSIYYSSPHDIATEDVASDILTTLARVRQGAGYPEPEQDPEFVALHKWNSFEMTVSTGAIRDGFYDELLALQGKKSTYWTGAAWMNQATATLWKYTEEKILPFLVGDEDELTTQL
jgi:hypothetical protein